MSGPPRSGAAGLIMWWQVYFFLRPASQQTSGSPNLLLRRVLALGKGANPNLGILIHAGGHPVTIEMLPMPPLTTLGTLQGDGIDGYGNDSPEPPEDFQKNFRTEHIDPGGRDSDPRFSVSGQEGGLTTD